MNENKTHHTLQELDKDLVFHYFFELCKIPHPSYKEKALSDALKNWGLALGLEVFQDHYNNVMIRKPGTPGKEKAPVVLLQAHIDMVCQKAVGIDHDFEKDPIIPIVEGDCITTGGRTTLGADNGIGVAYMMALLASDTIAHPPLEALFTTAEEEDMSGAENVDGSWFKATYLLNLDYAKDDKILCGSCGGNGARLTLPLNYEAAPQTGFWYTLELTGLPGGHSGEDIHRGHGNAGILLGRLLKRLKDKTNIRLEALNAGNFRLAIPREAHAHIWVSEENNEKLTAEIEHFKQILKKEYATVEKTAALSKKGHSPALNILTDASFNKILQCLYLAPNGIGEMNNAMPKVVESSANLGEVFIKNGTLHFVFEIRATHESTRLFINEKLEILAALIGCDYTVFAQYPGWEFDPHSKLLKKAQAVYLNKFGTVPEAVVFHAGVESASLISKIKGLTAIGLGPNAWGFHSPAERVNIQSTKKVYAFIVDLLSAIT